MSFSLFGLLALIVLAGSLQACQGQPQAFENPVAIDESQGLVSGKWDPRFDSLALTLKIELSGVGTQICSAIWIESDILLTAAHCLRGLPPELLGQEVLVQGSNPLRTWGIGRRIQLHPRFESDPRRFDLALLQFQPVTESQWSREFSVATMAWLPDATPKLIMTGAGIKAGYLEAPSEVAFSEAATFHGRVQIERSGILWSLLDFVSQLSLRPGDLLKLSAEGNSPWLCAGDSGGGLYAEDQSSNLILVGVNSRSKVFGYQGKTLCMPSAMIITPIGPHRDWLDSTLLEMKPSVRVE